MDKMQLVLAFASMISVIILALVQLIKTTVTIPKNFIPLIGLIVGVLIGWAAAPFTDLDTVMRLWGGGLAGLSATGLFELVFSDRPGKSKETDRS